MKIKVFFAVILAVLLILNMVGCKSNPNVSSSEPEHIVEEVPKNKDYLTLLYSMSDSFNPYAVKTSINRQLCQLIYEPLVKLDNNFKPVLSIAKDVKTEGKTCTVKINPYKFSDGSAVTADDIVYSFKLAKASPTGHSAKLYVAESASAVDSMTVSFKLTKADPYFINLLTFPIIKSGSEKIADSDSVLQPPVGCGRYKVNTERTGLVVNEHFYGEKSSIKEIRLINAPDTDSVTHYAQVGAADIYYNEISDGTILRMSGKKLDINSNSLLYIGINQNYGALKQNELRQALSSGIDRSRVCQNIYYNNAVSATGFFHPAWEDVKSVQNIQIEANLQITIENLEKIGYNSLDNKEIRKNSAGIPLKLTMLVNSENRTRVAAAQLITDQLLNCGISVTVIEKSYEKYMECLKNGDFQLYLGEIKLTDNMDISSMVTEGGSAAFGLLKPDDKKTEITDDKKNNADTEPITQEKGKTSGEVVSGFYEGQNTISDVASVLQNEMPFIPVCYRTGVLFYNDNIENVDHASESDIYFSIKSYIYNY